MKTSFLIVFVCISSVIYSQNGFEAWDKNYTYKSVEKIIQAEIDYAKEVEKDKTEGHYYVAISKFRFIAEFTGNERPINKEVLNSMKRVFKVKMGSAQVLNGLVSKEFEFNIGNSKIWMPIQNQLIDDFKNEMSKGKKALIYALFTNEHPFKGGIINAFLISEFTTQWE
ncbi:hypothetical protein [Siansivirga zeaxanthinifaciens]|uniref:Uncharacterized protein n=1 Tax=Siansivirga zeaxanthinifaciens CC-SAMT-1 TaxID=1454006 RepID=A0A0C5WCP0_9FLAO|nr:hypothetical protein [Siansivirga zeaxanthinifaciens]AJR04783.1 hypothetical protein AW14_04390 [Siansivirga zeaxanthinifaciens CC-SAMT-1]